MFASTKHFTFACCCVVEAATAVLFVLHTNEFTLQYDTIEYERRLHNVIVSVPQYRIQSYYNTQLHTYHIYADSPYSLDIAKTNVTCGDALGTSHILFFFIIFCSPCLYIYIYHRNADRKRAPRRTNSS